MVILEPLIFPKHQADFSKAEEREHKTPTAHLTTSYHSTCHHASILSPLSHRSFTLFDCDLWYFCLHTNHFTKQERSFTKQYFPLYSETLTCWLRPMRLVL